MGEPYGRGWLDLQRYAAAPATELGSYETIHTAVRVGIAGAAGGPARRSRTLTLNDDTPTANAETAAWIAEEIAAARAARAAEPRPRPPMDEETAPAARGEYAPPDAYELAMEAVRSGQPRGGH